MSRPREAVLDFVETRFPDAVVTPLTGDASTRRYYRVIPADGPPRVVMDYGRPFAGETDDIQLARMFRRAGLPVAEILETCGPVGCLLLEDLGDLTLESLMRDPASASIRRRELLEEAVALAVRVAETGTPVLARSERARGPELDPERFRFEMDFFLKHYARGLRALSDPPIELRLELHALADRAAGTPLRVFCHRDFHSRNLMVREDGSLTMVDIQDSRWGPDSYDLASLLRDAYVAIDEAWIDPLVEEYRAALGSPPSPAEFRERFDIVSAQRMIKALGTFGYQVTQRRSSRFGEGIPRTLERLRRLLPTLSATKKLHRFLDEAGLLADP